MLQASHQGKRGVTHTVAVQEAKVYHSRLHLFGAVGQSVVCTLVHVWVLFEEVLELDGVLLRGLPSGPLSRCSCLFGFRLLFCSMYEVFCSFFSNHIKSTLYYHHHITTIKPSFYCIHSKTLIFEKWPFSTSDAYQFW